MSADLQTPLKRAQGLGSAKSGTHHFIVQRITAVALIPLALWVIGLVLAVLHANYAQAHAMLHHPFAAVWLSIFVVAAFWHAQLGLQAVIEDYVHTRRLEVVAQLAVKFFCIAGAVTSVLAIVKIALG